MSQNQSIIKKAREISQDVLSVNAAYYDSHALFPMDNFKVFREEGFLGLLLPKRYGGLDITLSEFIEVMEVLAHGCTSSAMCFLMHQVSCINILKGAHPEQLDILMERFFKELPIMTQALSEPGTGSHSYLSELRTRFEGNSILLNGKKKFCTNGGFSDWYLIYTKTSNEDDRKAHNWVLVEKGTPGLDFHGQWTGMGLRGNSSIDISLNDVRVPRENLIGREEGKAQEILFGDNRTTFMLGHAAINTGIAAEALKQAVHRAKTRTNASAGPALCNHQAIRFYIADMAASLETTRLLVEDAVKKVDSGCEDAVRLIYMSKFLASETSKKVTDTAMQIFGGSGYSSEFPVERLFRDARAGALMGPTNELLKDWTGKIMCEMPLR